VGSPAVILADEPTGALDTKTSEEIMRILQRLNTEQGLTVILVTHEADIAAYAQRVLTMRDGVLVGDGPPKAQNERPNFLSSSISVSAHKAETEINDTYMKSTLQP
jgi:ABC-type lipoprotein export system ATPase subunit